MPSKKKNKMQVQLDQKNIKDVCANLDQKIFQIPNKETVGEHYAMNVSKVNHQAQIMKGSHINQTEGKHKNYQNQHIHKSFQDQQWLPDQSPKNSLLASQDVQTIKNRNEKFGTMQGNSMEGNIQEVSEDRQIMMDKARKRNLQKVFKTRNRVFHGNHYRGQYSELYSRHHKFKKWSSYQPVRVRHKRSIGIQSHEQK